MCDENEEGCCCCCCNDKEIATGLLELAMEHGVIKFQAGKNEKNIQELMQHYISIYEDLAQCVCCECEEEMVEVVEPSKKDKKKKK